MEHCTSSIESEFYKIDDLKYQKTQIKHEANGSGELMNIKLRYKRPDSDVSKLIVHPLVDGNIVLSRTSDDFRWSAAVAAFGMLLRDSEYVRGFSYDGIVQLAQPSRGEDINGYRAEFIDLVKSMGLFLY